MINILASPIDDGACGLYRVKQPLEKLQEHFPDEVNVDFIKHAHSQEVIKAGLEMADVIVVRPTASEFVKRIRELQQVYEKHGGKLPVKIVYDHDDNMLDINPLSDHYKDSGIKEWKLDEIAPMEFWKASGVEGTHLWKDKENGFDLERNKASVKKLLSSIELSDLYTGTTEELCNFYKFAAPQPNVAALPNCVDFAHYWNVPIRKSSKIRISWHGGSSHYVDIITILDDLIRVTNELNATYVHSGQHFIDDLDKRFNSFEEYGWIPTPAHPYRMALQNIDIGVIPLSGYSFNKYKSDIKWVEYSALKIPCVVANREPYSLSIQHGVTGLLYSDSQEFEEHLTQLAKDKAFRKRIGDNAYEWCYEHRNADKQAHLWLDAYKKLVEKTSVIYH